MTGKIIWSAVAENDLICIIDYIAEESTASALKAFSRIKEKCSKLYQHPLQGRVVPELKDFGVSVYRELIVDVWRVIYKVDNKTVHVVSVIDARRNVEDILLDRFI